VLCSLKHEHAKKLGLADAQAFLCEYHFPCIIFTRTSFSHHCTLLPDQQIRCLDSLALQYLEQMLHSLPAM
jgi:hypothetical protein